MHGQKRLMLTVGHPDDETFGAGSILARYAAEGVVVKVVCATRGEAGEIAEGSGATRETLGEVREAELRASLAVAGVHDLELLGYRDSGMAGTRDNGHPDAFSGAPEDEIVARLVGLFRSFRPHVTVTFDESGGYGHPDHIRISATTRKAFGLSSDPAYVSAAGEAVWSPPKLYYMAFPRSRVQMLVDALRTVAPESDMLRVDPDQLGVPDDRFTTRLDASEYLDTKLRAAAEHRSQRNPFDLLPDAAKREFLATDFLIRVHPLVDDEEAELETDLFAGL